MANEVLTVIVQVKWVALALFLVLPLYYERTSQGINEAVPVVSKS